MSRYEEYLPHVKDEFERFPASESFAYQQKFIEKPVIDIWAYKLKDLFQQKFPDYTFEKREFKLISTIDIDLAYCYKYKGFIRNVGGVLKDFAQNITEHAFDYLDAPPVVIGSRNWITPAYEMEQYFFPQEDWIIDAIHEKILPLRDHQVKNDFSSIEKLNRERFGV